MRTGSRKGAQKDRVDPGKSDCSEVVTVLVAELGYMPPSPDASPGPFPAVSSEKSRK